MRELNARPDQIAYVSFTKKAIREASERVQIVFPHLNLTDDFKYFRTLHSLAFKQLGLVPEVMLAGERLKEFGRHIGYPLSDGFEIDYEGRPHNTSDLDGDRAIAVCLLAAALQVSVEKARELSDHDISLPTVKFVDEQMRLFKEKNDLWGFEDLLDNDKEPINNVKYLIIDECQDLTPQQWGYAMRKFPDVDRVYIAGDEDQTLFEWAGARPKQMYNFTNAISHPLIHSYRVPNKIKSYADYVIRPTYGRDYSGKKDWFSRRGDIGTVRWVPDMNGHVDMLNKETWMLLARNNKNLMPFILECREQGVVFSFNGRKRYDKWSNSNPEVRAYKAFTALQQGLSCSKAWANQMIKLAPGTELPERLKMAHLRTSVRAEDVIRDDSELFTRPWQEALSRMTLSDRDYVKKLLANSEPLNGPGRVIVSTVHGAKGGEADNVYFTPVVNRKQWQDLRFGRKRESRVLYVAMTRAKKRLFLQNPRSRFHYDLPGYE